MRAFTLDSFDTPPGLREDLPAPTPADNEVLVSVRASSVNGADSAIAAGMLGGMFDHESPSCSAATTPASSSRSAPA
jgi:NADPH:quinone reductase-like Zn-dependent oxidoreductase